MIDTSTQDTLTHWLYTNAPAAWISALIALILFLNGLRLRKKPRRLLVRETRCFSFFFFHPMIRDEIVSTFAGKTVSDLGLIQYDLSNEGSEPIQKPSVTLTMPEETTILRVYLRTENDPNFDSQTKISAEKNRVTITMPYLNSFREHQQSYNLDIIVDGKTAPIKVSGSGAGWSVRHLPKARAMLYGGNYFLFGTFFGLIFMPLYISALHLLGFGPSTPMWKRLLLQVPYLAALAYTGIRGWKSLNTFRLLWRLDKDE